MARYKYKSLNKKEPQVKGIPFWDMVVSVLFLVSIGLLVWEIHLYRRTIIDVKILLIIFFSPGIILTPIFYNLLNKIEGAVGHWALHYILHSVVVGGILIFSLMSLNYYAADEFTKTESFIIKKKDSLPGSKGHRNERKPYAIIDYHGFEKQIIFDHSYERQMETSKRVILITKEGFLGFPILDDYYME